jgi:hypothetical protein
MKNKILAILVAAYLMVGCSSGGGTSGANGGSAVTAGQFLLTAGLTPVPAGASVDTNCEKALSTTNGVFRITLTNVTSTTGNLFPSGLILESYTVSFSPQSSGAPKLQNRTYGTSSNTVNSSAISTTVILVDAATTLPEYLKNSPGSCDSDTRHRYMITVTMRGKTLAGDPFAVSAAVLLAFFNSEEEAEEAPPEE